MIDLAAGDQRIRTLITKGTLLSLCLLASFALASLARAQPTVDHGGDWPAFLGPRGDSSSPETGILKTWPETGLPVVWHTQVGSGYGSCAIRNGKCCFFDRVSDKARLRCLNSTTGELIWTYTYPSSYEDLYGFDNGPRTSPVVDEDSAYVYGAEGQLHCVSLAGGQRRWMLDMAAEFGVVQNFFGVGSTPVREGDLLLVMVGGSPPDDQRIPPGQLDRLSADGTCIVALNKNDGSVVYSTGDDLASYSSIRVASVENRRLGFAFARGGLLAFQPEDGKLRFYYPWRARKLESVNASTPVIGENRVFISESYELGCCQLLVPPVGDPEVAWRDNPRSREQILATHWMTPVLVEGHLYGCSGESSADAQLVCVDWQTGEVKWRQPGLSRFTLLAVDGHLVCLSEDGHLRLVAANPLRYELITECDLRAAADQPGLRAGDLLLKKPVWAAPVLSHGLLYVRGGNRLVCAELIPRAVAN